VLESYRAHVAERAALGIPPLPLTARQTEDLIGLLKNPPVGEEANLLELITHRVRPVSTTPPRSRPNSWPGSPRAKKSCALISKEKATELLGTMLGGYNVKPLIDLLDGPTGTIAAEALKKTLLVFDFFHDVKELADQGNAHARGVAAELGRRRVVHLASAGARGAEADRLQGHRRNQHR
jgi:aconitate hydratase 2/2-methylisocitrate dehydratase